MKKMILIIISAFLIAGCGNKEKMDNKELLNLEVVLKESVPVYSDISFNDLIENINLDVSFSNEKINTEKIGVFERVINYQYQNQDYEYKYTIEVIDNEVPFVFGGTNITKLKNSNIDLCKQISHGDNYDSRPKCEIVGEFDSSKIGSYDLKMIVKDSSNNKIEKNIKLKIVESFSNKTNTPISGLDFKVVKNNNRGENIEYGVDVSSWQTNVDYEALKAAGISFVMIRIGFQKNNGIKMDSYFKENLNNAKKAGLKVGIYYYSYAKNIDEVLSHVSWIVNELDGVSLELPIAFDWENWSSFNEYNLSFYELNMLASTFIESVNATKKYVGCLYSSKYYLEKIWKEAKSYPVWLAHYTDKTGYEGNYFMWQLSSNGRIDGIKGAVDFNILYN